MHKKNFYIITLLLLFYGMSYSQVPVKINKYLISAGMGISMTNTPSFNDYLRQTVLFSNTDSIKSFSVGFEVFGGLEYSVNKKFSVKLDYSYFIKTHSYVYSYYQYDFDYNIHQPYLMAYYVTRGTHYRFKYGGGAGYHFASMTKTISKTSEFKYKASGPAFRGELIFSADLSNTLESYLGGFITWNIIGTLKDSGGNTLKNPTTNEDVNLSGYGVGARLGFSIKL
jgi:hypothetical protein